DLRSPPARADDRKIARPETAEALRLEDERRPGSEIRLAHDQAAALPDLDDESVVYTGFYTRRKRRIVRPEPTAPRPRPVESRISATSGNAHACTSASPERCGRIAGSTIALPSTRKKIASSDP